MDKERRKHPRFPTLGHAKKEIAKVLILKPVNLFFWEIRTTIPGILLDLSAGGMGLLAFMPVKHGTKFRMKIDLPSLKTEFIDGNVVWTLQKGDTWKLGIEFSKINSKDRDAIRKIAEDYTACELRILKNEKPVCFKGCSYQLSCPKEQKKIPQTAYR